MSFKNKRVELVGDLFNCQLKQLVTRFQKDLGKKLEKTALKPDNLLQQVQYNCDGSIITNGFRHAFCTGNWASFWPKSESRSGVVATLKRTNPMETISHLRQLRFPVPCVFKHTGAYYLNKYAMGRVCLVETPDNDNCGIVNTLAIGCQISIESSTKPIIELLSKHGTQDLNEFSSSCLKNVSKIFLNGMWVGNHKNPKDVVKNLRTLRRQGEIHQEVEIVEDPHQKEIKIFCDGGRFMRPLVVVEENHPCKIKQQMNELQFKRKNLFSHLLHHGIIEFVGPEEEERCIVAEDYKELKDSCIDQSGKQFTHCQLHPCFSFSLGASLVPFANHNHHVRVMLQSQKHGKQAIGFYTTCAFARSDTASHQLLYPQKPICETRVGTYLARKDLNNGQNAIVAVSTFYGYNQEESIIINQASIDRGIFKSNHFQSFNVQVDGKTERFTKPTTWKADHPFYQYKLDDDGLPHIGDIFFPSDILVGKEQLESETSKFRNSGLKLKATEKGRVDQVILAGDSDDNVTAHVRLRETRDPVVGDKFSSRHGQKGVVGLTCSQEDMFFTREGIVPDIIINPHSFPSRQTVGQFAESIVAKIAAVSGRKIDATPFNGTEVHTIMEELHRLKYNRGGKESMMNGKTGEQLKEKIMISPIFYQRLVHMAIDKLKCRSKGPVHPFTRQPVADRKRYGGVKIGEMEKDCLISHGAAANLRERLFLLSDPYKMLICSLCNIVASKDKQGFNCHSCKSRKNIVQVPMPYACKLLYQELLSVGVILKFWTELC